MNPHNNPGIERRFIISLVLTLLVLVAEVAGGLWTGSLALLSDSAHVFMDIFALGLSFLALKLSSLPADDRHTYGYHRLEVLAALINGITLGAIAVGIWWEAYQRWQAPQEIRGLEMFAIATVGLVVNIIVAFVLGGHQHVHAGGHDHDHEHEHEHEHDHTAARDINVQSAFLHVVGDAISSVGVMVAALIVMRTGWTWVDPLMSVLIGVLIVFSAVRVLRSSIHILIEGVPEGLDINRIGDVMQAVPAVLEVHDLHVWNICSGHVALSSHVVVCEDCSRPLQQVMQEIKGELSHEFGIEHTTLQMETSELHCQQR